MKMTEKIVMANTLIKIDWHQVFQEITPIMTSKIETTPAKDEIYLASMRQRAKRVVHLRIECFKVTNLELMNKSRWAWSKQKQWESVFQIRTSMIKMIIIRYLRLPQHLAKVKEVKLRSMLSKCLKYTIKAIETIRPLKLHQIKILVQQYLQPTTKIIKICLITRV